MLDGMDNAVTAIQLKRREVSPERAVLIAITGSDGCGKGYVAGKIVSELKNKDLKAAAIHADGWLNLPHKRFNPANPAVHFYEHAIRFDELFQQLILPLVRQRRHHLVADFAEETARDFRRQTYCFEEVDVVVLEGILLLKRGHRLYFDLAFWVDCTFETALERALQRRQEGLSLAETVRAYETIYFPAQRIHFAKDDPRTGADWIITNDWRLDRKASDEKPSEREFSGEPFLRKLRVPSGSTGASSSRD